MNQKMAKKLRWYARTQEAMMPDPVVNEKGVSSLLLVYEHPRTYTDRVGDVRTFINRTLQYNPRTSGKGFYKVLKKKRARIKGSIPYVRYMCQRRIIELLAARSQGNSGAPADSQPGLPGPVAV
jgi:hypothetical protein